MRTSIILDPIADHYAYVNELGRQEMIRDQVYGEMYDLKQDALERIDAVVHPSHVQDFIKILCYAVNEGLPEAENIAKNMGLSQHHFLALEGDEAGMEDYLDKQEWSRTPDIEPDYDRYCDRYI